MSYCIDNVEVSKEVYDIFISKQVARNKEIDASRANLREMMKKVSSGEKTVEDLQEFCSKGDAEFTHRTLNENQLKR